MFGIWDWTVVAAYVAGTTLIGHRLKGQPRIDITQLDRGRDLCGSGGVVEDSPDIALHQPINDLLCVGGGHGDNGDPGVRGFDALLE